MAYARRPSTKILVPLIPKFIQYITPQHEIIHVVDMRHPHTYTRKQHKQAHGERWSPKTVRFARVNESQEYAEYLDRRACHQQQSRKGSSSGGGRRRRIGVDRICTPYRS